MRKIFALAWKDTLVRFSSRSELLFFIVLPLIFTVLVAGGIPIDDEGDNRLPVLVVNEDGSALAGEFVAALQSSRVVRPVTASSRAEAEAGLADDEALALVVVPAGFGEGLLRGEPAALDVQAPPNDPDAAAATRAIEAAAGQVSRALVVAHASLAEAERVRPFASEAERQAYFDEALDLARAAFAAAPARLVVSMARDPEAEGLSGFNAAAQASAGQLITWVFIPLLSTSALFAQERERGTLRRLLTTPTQKATFLAGTLSGQLALALVQMALLVLFGHYVLNLRWGQSLAALAAVLVTFGLASVALGTALGTVVRTTNQASGVSIMLGMVLALLGGCWYPLELFPEAARTAALALPTRWAMQGLTDLVMRGQGLAEVSLEAAVLLGFAAVFFVVGVWRFRYE